MFPPYRSLAAVFQFAFKRGGWRELNFSGMLEMDGDFGLWDGDFMEKMDVTWHTGSPAEGIWAQSQKYGEIRVARCSPGTKVVTTARMPKDSLRR